VVSAYNERINSLADTITRIEHKEREEKEARQAEGVIQKAEDRLNNKPDEREGRVWFQSGVDKKNERREPCFNLR
jgi:F420-0:gamma-glutamyl ligase